MAKEYTCEVWGNDDNTSEQLELNVITAKSSTKLWKKVKKQIQLLKVSSAVDIQVFAGDFSDIQINQEEIQDVTFERCKFTDVDFLDTNLTSVSFRWCYFINVSFSRCNLRKTHFQHTNLGNTWFSSCQNLKHARFRSTGSSKCETIGSLHSYEHDIIYVPATKRLAVGCTTHSVKKWKQLLADSPRDEIGGYIGTEEFVNRWEKTIEAWITALDEEYEQYHNN